MRGTNSYFNNSILRQRQQLPHTLDRRAVSVTELFLQFLHEILVVFAVVVIAAVRQRRVY